MNDKGSGRARSKLGVSCEELARLRGAFSAESPPLPRRPPPPRLVFGYKKLNITLSTMSIGLLSYTDTAK